MGVFGDEVKYFPEEKFTNLLKAVRGFYVRYGQSVWYRSRTLTTDMPNPNHLGEYDWILKLSAQNKKEEIMLMLRAGLVYNECKKTYVSHLQEYRELVERQRTERTLQNQVDKAARAVELARRNMKRWEERWIKTRRRVSFFLFLLLMSMRIYWAWTGSLMNWLKGWRACLVISFPLSRR